MYRRPWWPHQRHSMHTLRHHHLSTTHTPSQSISVNCGSNSTTTTASFLTACQSFCCFTTVAPVQPSKVCHVCTALVVTLRLQPAQAIDVYPLYLYSVSFSADVHINSYDANSDAPTLQSSERIPSLTQTGNSRRSKRRLCIHSYLHNTDQHSHWAGSTNLGDAWFTVLQLRPS